MSSTAGKSVSGPLPVHFFTIVLNGGPWIRYHVDVFRRLPFDWHWHVVEGVALLRHDTAWSVRNGGRVPVEFHRNGRSCDGTSEYLDEVRASLPERVTVYRKPPGQFWDGKLEMVRAPMPHVRGGCLLWEVDSDELWTEDQIVRMRDLFLAQPRKRAAYFSCHYFVGPDLIVDGPNGNDRQYSWLRVWRRRSLDRWLSHEPPIFASAVEAMRARIRHPRRRYFEQTLPISSPLVFSQYETGAAGLVFQHMAYVTEAQVAFKQIYYGYRGAIDGWRRLQHATLAGQRLADYLPWVADESSFARASLLGIVPLMKA